ncbi:hypothetical protein SMA5143A_3642 [Streptomyces sp. MA5143a]|nr:hypothetical protein SMA5143A_3642 [Streptomyces sp. MA5143a]
MPHRHRGRHRDPDRQGPDRRDHAHRDRHRDHRSRRGPSDRDHRGCSDQDHRGCSGRGHPASVRAAGEPVVRGRRRSPTGRDARGRRRTRRGRAVRAGPRARHRIRRGRAVRAGPKAHHRTRRGHPAARDHWGHRDRRGHQVRRGHPVHQALPGPDRSRTGGPEGSARRGGSSARGASPGSRTRHRRRRRAGAAAGSGAPGSRPGPGRGHRDRARRGPARRGRGRASRGAARPGCTWSPCWSGSSTGTPRRRARRPHGACGTAGRAPARRRGAAGVRRDPRDLPRPEAAEGSRAAGIRNRRPGAAVAAGVRHRPYGDRRPRTSRRNPTGVRSGRSACRRFPLSFPALGPGPVAATGRYGRACPDPRWGSQALS